MLGKKLTLNDVLYVPELNCNLVIVAKLRKYLKCLVKFFDDLCVL